MAELVLAIFDWVPEGPLDFVRNMRLRWACKEAELTYTATESCITRILARPAFKKVYFDQIAHFAAAAQ